MPDGKWKNIYSGFFFLCIGIAICIGAWKLGIFEGHVPRAGFMPFLAGMVISGLSLLLIFLVVFGRQKRGEANEAKIKGDEKEGSQRIGLAIFALIFPIFLIQLLGFLITIFIFFFFMFKWIERQNWKTSTLTSFLIALGFYILFQVLLEIPFPKGIFGF